MLPPSCRKLEPKAELEEFMQKNKVVVFVSPDDQEATNELFAHFEALSVTHARVDVSTNADFAKTLTENAEHFVYSGH